VVVVLWLASVAFAGDEMVAIPFEPPAGVPLFLKAELVTVRGTVKGADCPGAVAAALADVEKKGTVVRLAASAEDLTSATETTCRQRVAGDTVSASVVDLTAIVVTPGSPPTVYPAVSAERAVQIAGLLGAVAGGGLPSVAIDDLDGRAWVRLGRVTFDETLDRGRYDDNGRAVRVYEKLVPAWVSTWARVLATVPEVFGAILEVEVVSEIPDEKRSRSVELIRFAIPTTNARVFLRGGTMDHEFLAAARVERATDPKARNFERFTVDTDAMGGGTYVTTRTAPELTEADLQGMDDQAPPQ
jgi:hypothetical protein